MNRKQFVSLILAGVIAVSAVPMSSLAAEQSQEGTTVSYEQIQKDTTAESTQKAPDKETETETSQEENPQTEDKETGSETEKDLGKEERESDEKDIKDQTDRKPETPEEEVKEETYTITWNVNGEIHTTRVKKGDIPVYDGPAISSTADESTISEFAQWMPSVRKAVKDTEYTARFRQRNRWQSAEEGHRIYLEEDGKTRAKGLRVINGETYFFDEQRPHTFHFSRE